MILKRMDKIYQEQNWLLEQYWGFDLTLKEMEILSNCSNVCINYWMNKYNIPLRPKCYHLKEMNQNKEHQSNAGKARAKITNKLYSHLARERMLKNNPGYLMHARWKERNPIAYHNHQLNAGIKGGEIMQERLTDWDFLNEHGCLKSQFPYPTEFNKKLKQSIMYRDRCQCQVCNEFVFTGHSIHHIDYDKTNNNPDNLILLCRSCHSKTCFDREYWTRYFENIMS